MANRKTIIVTITIFIFTILTSCNNTEAEEPKVNYSLDTAVYEWVDFKSNDSLNLIVDLEYHIPKFKYPKKISNDINGVLFYGKDTTVSDFDVEAYKRNTLIYYYESALEDNYISGKTNSQYIIKTKTQVYLNNPNIVSIRKETYRYTGGAHGNIDIENLNYNLRENHLITINDIFNKKNKKNVKNIILQKIKSKYNIPKNSDISEFNFFVSDSSLYVSSNLLLTDSNIVFTYNTYEISPFDIGVINIKIPYTEIQNNIKANNQFIVK